MESPDKEESRLPGLLRDFISEPHSYMVLEFVVLVGNFCRTLPSLNIIFQPIYSVL